MPRNNRVRRKLCDCFGRDGERPHVCAMCGRKFVYCTSFLKHVKAHRDDGPNDGRGTFRRPANSGPLAPGSPGARDDDSSRAVAVGPDASDTPTSTTATAGHADGSPAHAVAGRFHADRDGPGRDACGSDVIVISSDSSDGDSDADGAADACDDPPADGPITRNAPAGRYDVPLLSDISDASDGDTDGTRVRQTVPVDLTSARGDPCTVCSLCYIGSSAAVYQSIICPYAPDRSTVATAAKINTDRS